MRGRVALGAVLLTGAIPAGADAANRFAAVNGSGAPNTCTDVANPCTLIRAGEVGGEHETVFVAPGTYNLTTPYLVTKNGTLAGTPGQPRPRIIGTGPVPTITPGGPGGFVRHVYVEATSFGAAALETTSHGSVEDVIAVSRGGSHAALESRADLVADSVAIQLGPNGTGLAVLNNGAEVRNVTALADENGVGLLVRTDGGIQAKAQIVNTIARGAADDVRADSANANPGGDANLSFSNFDLANSSTATGGTIDAGPGNQSGAPLFVDRDLGDVHQVAGSPTINGGTAALPDFSPFDIDGQPRVVGPAPDVGADEFNPTTPPNADTVAPAFLKAPAFSRSRFPAAKSGPAFKPARTYGATITYTLSEPATTTFTVQRPLAGRKSGKKCVKPTRKNRKKKRCTRYSTLKGSFADAGTSGVNKVRFSGRLRGKRLKPGKYRLAAIAKDAAGLKSKTAYRNFRIVR